MARQIVILEWCDVCLLKDEQQVECSHSDVVCIGDTEKRLATCELHYNKFVAPLLEALQDFGTKPEAEPTPPGGGEKSRCRVPGCGRDFTRQGMVQHIRRSHPELLDEAPDVTADTPTDFQSSLNTVTKDGETVFICEVQTNNGKCEWTSKFPQGIGAHRRKKHGIRGSSATARAAAA